MTTDVINAPRDDLDLIRFDFTNGDGRPDSKMMTHDEMRQRYSELLISNALSLGGGSTVSAGGVDEREVWAVPVLDGEKKTTFYTEQLPFVPGIGVKQLGEPVRMVEARLNPAPATADSDAPGIPVEHEDEATVKEFGGIVESCHFCGAPTRYWHAGTNNPVCPDCAKKHRVEELPNWLADSDVREVKP